MWLFLYNVVWIDGFFLHAFASGIPFSASNMISKGVLGEMAMNMNDGYWTAT